MCNAGERRKERVIIFAENQEEMLGKGDIYAYLLEVSSFQEGGSSS